MGSIRKTYLQWKKHVPRTALKREVYQLARSWGIEIVERGGSHAMFSHPKMAKYAARCDYSEIKGNGLSICSVHGREVKRIYIQRLMDFLAFLEDEQGIPGEDERTEDEEEANR